MATLNQLCAPRMLRIASNHKIDEFIENQILRRCMVVSASLMLAGLGVPLLMAIGVLPANFLLGLLGLTLVTAGSILALKRCGEI